MSSSESRTGRPIYDLASIKAAYAAGEVGVLVPAYQSAFELGLLPPDIAAAVSALEPQDFVRSEHLQEDVYAKALGEFECEMAFSLSPGQRYLLVRFAVSKPRKVKPKRS